MIGYLTTLTSSLAFDLLVGSLTFWKTYRLSRDQRKIGISSGLIGLLMRDGKPPPSLVYSYIIDNYQGWFISCKLAWYSFIARLICQLSRVLATVNVFNLIPVVVRSVSYVFMRHIRFPANGHCRSLPNGPGPMLRWELVTIRFLLIRMFYPSRRETYFIHFIRDSYQNIGHYDIQISSQPHRNQHHWH